MSLDFWPSDVYGGSPPDNIDAICEAIHDATKGFGTNEKYVFYRYSEYIDRFPNLCRIIFRLLL